MNRVILIGNVGKDAELLNFDNGSKIAVFSLATSESWKNEAGEKQTKTHWHYIKVVKGSLVDVCSKYVKKGIKVMVEGNISYRNWEDKEGNKHTSTEIVCSGFELLSKNEAQDNRNDF